MSFDTHFAWYNFVANNLSIVYLWFLIYFYFITTINCTRCFVMSVMLNFSELNYYVGYIFLTDLNYALVWAKLYFFDMFCLLEHVFEGDILFALCIYFLDMFCLLEHVYEGDMLFVLCIFILDEFCLDYHRSYWASSIEDLLFVLCILNVFYFDYHCFYWIISVEYIYYLLLSYKDNYKYTH